MARHGFSVGRMARIVGGTFRTDLDLWRVGCSRGCANGTPFSGDSCGGNGGRAQSHFYSRAVSSHCRRARRGGRLCGWGSAQVGAVGARGYLASRNLKTVSARDERRALVGCPSFFRPLFLFPVVPHKEKGHVRFPKGHLNTKKSPHRQETVRGCSFLALRLRNNSACEIEKVQTTPCAIMALATFMKPATLAPRT